MNFEQPPKPAENTEEKKEKLEKPTILETIRKKTGKIARGLAMVGALATTESGDNKPEINLYDKGRAFPPQPTEFAVRMTEQKISEQEYSDLVKKDPEKIFVTAQLFKDESWAGKILNEAAKEHPAKAFEYSERYRGVPEYNLIISTAKYYLDSSYQNSRDEYPTDPVFIYLNNIQAWIGTPSESKIFEEIHEGRPEEIAKNFKYFSQFKNGYEICKKLLEDGAKRHEYSGVANNPESLPDEDWADKILMEAAEEAPRALLYSSEKLEGKKYEKIVTKIINTRPDIATGMITIDINGDLEKKFNIFLENSEDPMTKAVYELRKIGNQNGQTIFKPRNLREAAGERERLGVFAELIAKKINSANEVVEIYRDDEKTTQALFSLIKEPDLKSRAAIEKRLSEIALKNIEQINRLHEAPDQERFSIVENFSAEQIYFLMVHGEEEVFTSTFNGLFNRTIEKLQKENISGSQLLEKTNFLKFRTFIRLCTEFNRLDDFLKTIPENEQEKILRRFVSDLETAKDPLREAVSIAEAINSIDNPKIIGILEDEVKTQIKSTSEKTTVLYKLIASTFNEKGSDEEWLKEIERDYKLPSLNTVEAKDLFNKNNVNIQQYFFYNDEDGIASFKNFVEQYKNKQNWSVKDRGTFVSIESEENGRHLKIYANKPEDEDSGPEEIAKELEKSEIKTIVVVHRGHSYHAHKTISRIPKIAKIVSLGSCGGYRNLSEVLNRAPEAHIISTKGTGTKWVNDPLFKMLNQEILSGHDIKWSEFWNKAEQELGDQEKFKDYVPPHKNFGAMFIKAYEKATSETSK